MSGDAKPVRVQLLRKKGWRQPVAKPGQLKAQWGKERFSDRPEILYVWGGKGASKPDARVLGYALEDAPVFDGKSLAQVLSERGYDLTTLRFSVEIGDGAVTATQERARDER